MTFARTSANGQDAPTAVIRRVRAIVAQNRQIPRPCPAIRERTSQNLRSRDDPGHSESTRRKNESALTIFGLDDLSEVRRQRTSCRIVQIAGEGGKAGRASEER